MKLYELTELLDSYLELDKVPFETTNGLQIEGETKIEKIALAVDPCIPVIKKANQWNADLLLTHHPLISTKLDKINPKQHPLETGRIKEAQKGKLSVYCVHLPLDRHPEVGNAATIARKLNLEIKERFGNYKNKIEIGWWAEGKPTPYSDFVKKTENVIGKINAYNNGPEKVQKVGIMTGSGLKYLNEAHQKGIDTYISGTPVHQALLSSEELKINVIFGGHYATEIFGVQEVGKKIKQEYEATRTKFIPYPTHI